MRFGLAASLSLTLGLCACAIGPDGRIAPLPFAAPNAPSVPAAAAIAPAMPAAIAAWNGPEREALAAFYESRGFAPVWFDGGPYAGQRAVVVEELAARGAAVQPTWATGPASPDAELGLSAAALQGTRGMTAVDVVVRSAASPVATALLTNFSDAVAATEPAVATADLFEGQAEAIERYRRIAAAGGWPLVPDGPTLEPFTVDARVEALRARMVATGDLGAGTSQGPVYDAALVAAVERFQARHGLAPDGVVGPATRRAMNVPVEARLRQLERAEMLRAALAYQLGDRFVLVNVPAYELRYVEGGEVRLGSDVIVGSVEHQTPLFSHAIDHLVFNPQWAVPTSIADRVLLAKFKKDPAGMAAQGYVLVDREGRSMSPTAIDWANVNGSIPYRVRQRPGGDNALGDVKFMFPNEHAVYLHDTPGKSLFGKSMRALSNGCVRVSDPMALAELLLATDGWDRAGIDDIIAKDRTKTVPLGRSVPVHLVYLTAWTAPDGTVQFRDDVYGLESEAVRTAGR